jgi:hypothetical protein
MVQGTIVVATPGVVADSYNYVTTTMPHVASTKSTATLLPSGSGDSGTVIVLLPTTVIPILNAQPSLNAPSRNNDGYSLANKPTQINAGNLSGASSPTTSPASSTYVAASGAIRHRAAALFHIFSAIFVILLPVLYF